MTGDKPPYMYIVFQWLLNKLGQKRYYPQVQKIERYIVISTPHNKKFPSTMVLLKGLVDLLSIVINRIYNKYFWAEQWFLLFDISHNPKKSFTEYTQIIPPNDRFWADPHLIKTDREYFLFVEEYIYKQQKGRISVIEVDQLGNYKNPIQIIDQNYHLSYPFVFQNNNKYYLIPESAANRTVQLYESSEFPYSWHFVMNLLDDIIAVDSTILYYANLWWLFTAIPKPNESLPKTQLHLFYSDTLLSNKWMPHQKNPIVPDYISSRSAGRIFNEDGKLFRPSQDASINYGRGVFINEIINLSTIDYSEKIVSSIQIDISKHIIGPHTYTKEGPVTVMDAYRKLPRFIRRNEINRLLRI